MDGIMVLFSSTVPLTSTLFLFLYFDNNFFPSELSADIAARISEMSPLFRHFRSKKHLSSVCPFLPQNVLTDVGGTI